MWTSCNILVFRKDVAKTVNILSCDHIGIKIDQGIVLKVIENAKFGEDLL